MTPLYTNCYFCSDTISNAPEHGPSNYYCKDCASTNGLESVITTIVSNEVKFVHMYFLKNNERYHVRLHVQDGFTAIGIIDKPLHELAIPGLTLSPTNVKIKLGTYLLFS